MTKEQEAELQATKHYLMQDPLGKILMAMAIALLGWQIKTTQELTVEVAVLKEQVLTATSDRYTGAQALSDKAVIDNRLNRLENWVQNLSNRLADVESHIRNQE